MQIILCCGRGLHHQQPPLPHPHPYSVNKFSIINEILSVFRSKFLILLELFAESSYQRSYGRFRGNSEPTMLRIALGRIGFGLWVEGSLEIIVRRSGVIICKGWKQILNARLTMLNIVLY
jgi:hypothetical protein